MVRYRIDGAVIAIGMKPTTPVPGSAIGPQQGRPPLEAAFSRQRGEAATGDEHASARDHGASCKVGEAECGHKV
jgi:hypothetical protein